MPVIVPLSGGVSVPGGSIFDIPIDEISGDGQYEYRGLVLNDGLNIMVLRTEGLFELPEFKSLEYELLDDDGGVVSADLLGMRRIVMDLAIRANSEPILQERLQQVRYVFQPQAIDYLFRFQRSGLGQRQLWARPRRMSGFNSDFRMPMGLVYGSVMLVAADPRILSPDEQNATITIPSGGISMGGTVNQAGNFDKGAWPVLEIDGPVTNPRVVNAADENRSIKVDMVINAGQTLILDARKRTATMGGVDQYANVRADNQWWRLLPGDNSLTFSRTNSPVNTGVLRVKWYTTWV